MRPIVTAVWCACILAAAGCTTPNASFTPCALPAGVQAALVYPQPGSSGNSTSLSQVIIASSAPLPATDYVLLSFPFNPVTAGARFGSQISVTQPPFPAPNQPASYPSPTYYVSAIGLSPTVLPAGATVTVSVNDTANACSPGVTVGTFGT